MKYLIWIQIDLFEMHVFYTVLIVPNRFIGKM